MGREFSIGRVLFSSEDGPDSVPIVKPQSGFKYKKGSKHASDAGRKGGLVKNPKKGFGSDPQKAKAAAREAGRKGGASVPKEKRPFSDPEKARVAAQKGGRAKAEARRKKAEEAKG